VAALSPRDTVAVGMVEPARLTGALARQAGRLAGLRVLAWPLLGPQSYVRPEFGCVFLSAPGNRQLQHYLPVRLADAHSIMVDGTLAPSVVFVHVSPPDADGWCSFGVAADYTFDTALHGDAVVVAEVNESMPRVRGAATVHVSQCDYLVRSDVPIPEMAAGTGDSAERAIGESVAAWVPDRATLQVGIGKLPGAAVRALSGRRGLGIQSGVIGDAVMDLHLEGVIDGRHKALYGELVVTASVLGSRKLYAWVDGNPDVWLMPMSWVHDAQVLSSDPTFTSVNTALQIDVTGQVNAESVGEVQIGNAGGLASFHRAAAASPAGRAIVALRSRTTAGAATIVAGFGTADPVTSLRADADVYVTEYGSVSLRGHPITTRVRALAALAHPEDREPLLTRATDLGLLAEPDDH
jgi:acyl-CoA hydrolase